MGPRCPVSETYISKLTDVLSRIGIPLADFDPNESTCWADALLLFELLTSLPNLRHLIIEVDRSVGQETTLAILATLVAPPPVVQLASTTSPVPCLEKIECLSLQFTEVDTSACHPRFLEVILPLLDRMVNLKSLELALNELTDLPERSLLPPLDLAIQHLPAGLRELRIQGDFAETPTVLSRVINFCPTLKRLYLEVADAFLSVQDLEEMSVNCCYPFLTSVDLRSTSS